MAARQLSAEEISIFRDCFNEYDQDRGGNISSDEFARVMRKTSPAITDEEVAKIISEVDLDGDGTINFDEFITMMTGQPYKSPETAAQEEEDKAEEGTPTTTTTTTTSCTSTSTSTSTSPASPSTPSSTASFGAAVRGVGTMSARLQRQRLANQVYKDAWAAIDPTLGGSITPAELARVAAGVPGLELTAEDVQELVDPDDERGAVVSYERFLAFAKRQEVDDIVSGYGA